MAIALLVIGLGWALLGLSNCYGTATRAPNDPMALGVALVFNVLLFILPGLAAAAIGMYLKRRETNRSLASKLEAERLTRSEEEIERLVEARVRAEVAAERAQEEADRLRREKEG